MSELRDRIIKSLQIPREKAARMGYKNAKGALDAVSAGFVGTALNDGVRFFDRTTVDRGKNEISQGGETCEIRFTENTTSPFKEKKLAAPAISFFAERIISFSNYNAIVDTLGDFYEIYEGAASANPGLDFGALIGDAVANPGDTPGSLKLDVLYFKNQTMGSLRERAAGFEDALHYMFGNQVVPEVAPKFSGKSPSDPNKTKAEIEQDEAYFSPIEVFIRDVTAEAIRSWGTDDDRVIANITVAVRRAVREGLERGNERANAINNINMACDDVLAVFQGLTRENYQEKMDQYIHMVTNKPALKDFLQANLSPLPSQPIPSEYIRDYLLSYMENPSNAGKITDDLHTMTPAKLQETYLRVSLSDYFDLPENAGKKPADFDTLTHEQLEKLAEINHVQLPISNNPKFDSIEYVCSQSAMYGQHLRLAEIECGKARGSNATERQALSYWATTYGITIHPNPPERDTDPATIRATVASRKATLESQRNSEKNLIKRARLDKQIQQVTNDLALIDGPTDATQIRIISGNQIVVRPPRTSVNIMNSNDATIRDWTAYTEKLGEVASKNDAMLLMTCCCILYDLNLNKLGGEIITANEVLERLGYDKVAGGINFDPEQQKQVLSILNNLFYLNEEQRVNLADGGTLHQTIQRFQHYVYQMYDKYADPIGKDADGNPIYPPGKLPRAQLKEDMNALGMNPDSPFFGRGKEIFEQLNMALSTVAEGYAINNFNPLKTIFRDMDPKMRDMSYRKAVMDYYKKEGLLPAKAVRIQKIEYKLDDEYKPTTIIEQPPRGPRAETIERLDYCEEVGHVLSKEHRYTAGTKSKKFRDSSAGARMENYEHQQLEILKSTFKKCEHKEAMFAILTEAVRSGKISPELAEMVTVTENSAGGITVVISPEVEGGGTFEMTAEERLMFLKFAPMMGTSFGSYQLAIDEFNQKVDLVNAEIASNPNVTEEELLAKFGTNRAMLAERRSELAFKGDYQNGKSNTIFPKLMNPGAKLAFSLLTEAHFDQRTGKYFTSMCGVEFKNPQHYARMLQRVGMQVDKDIKFISNGPLFKTFGSLMHLTIIDNQFVYAPAYEIGPRGGITVRNNMDVTSDNRHAVPEKIKAKDLEPTDKVWIVTSDGKIEQITGDAYSRTPPVTGPLMRLPSGEYLPALQYNLVMDALAMEAGKGGKKRTVGVQGADGVTHGLATPVDIRDCLELNDPKLATEDVPAPANLENPDIDGLVPSDHVSST